MLEDDTGNVHAALSHLHEALLLVVTEAGTYMGACWCLLEIKVPVYLMQILLPIWRKIALQFSWTLGLIVLFGSGI